jgi:L-iditol 2-dehydrogenase
MRSIRLYGPRDLRPDLIPEPGDPKEGEAVIRVGSVGICGSDLHVYSDGKIGETDVRAPLVLGHEFAGVVERVGPGSVDGGGEPLVEGIRVAVDPAQPCGLCEMCQRGHPNLCVRLHFCGLYPDDGALREKMIVPSRTCFRIPASLDDDSGAMLEPLGIAIHAANLSRIKVGDSVSVHGAGPIGLLILQVAKLAGANPMFAVEKLPWRLTLAERFGAVPIDPAAGDPALQIQKATRGRGVDIAFEAGWAEELVQETAETVRPGGRIILVGIPADDRCSLKHSTARRKGLTFLFSRRMKHTYPWSIELVEKGRVDVQSLISHRLPLERAPEAFAMNANYEQNVVKVIIHVAGRP